MLISISLNNSTVLVLVNGKKFELTRTRTRNSNSTWLETRQELWRITGTGFLPSVSDVIPMWSIPTEVEFSSLSVLPPPSFKSVISRVWVVSKELTNRIRIVLGLADDTLIIVLQLEKKLKLTSICSSRLGTAADLANYRVRLLLLISILWLYCSPWTDLACYWFIVLSKVCPSSSFDFWYSYDLTFLRFRTFLQIWIFLWKPSFEVVLIALR